MNIPQTAHTPPYARLLTCVATCTFMSKSPVMTIRANRLSFSELQNASFCILKQAVLVAETGHIAARNGLFGSAMCAYGARGTADWLCCALASIGRLRMFIFFSEVLYGDSVSIPLPKASTCWGYIKKMGKSLYVKIN